MLKSYKFRIYPNKTQADKLEQTFGCCRFVWNKYVEMFNNGEKLKSITELKKEFVFLNDVSTVALQQVQRNVHKTLTQFFNKERKVKLGRPTLSISERTYVCSNCGTVIDRDLNAAINIHALGFTSALRTLSTEVTKYDEVFSRIKESR